MSNIVLTSCQQKAHESFTKFILDPDDHIFVLSGYSGTGKSTLVNKLIDELPNLFNTLKLIDPDLEIPEVVLSATTNKAAINLASVTGKEVNTIHSVLGLRVHTDYETQVTRLIYDSNSAAIYNTLLFVDEASYIDTELMGHIQTRTKDCKIVFIGDPAQLLSVGSKYSPVFRAGYTGVEMTEIVRQQKGNPIQNLTNSLRDTVNTGKFFQCTPDGIAIKHQNREDFEKALIQEFTRPDWQHNDSKVLSWTNNRAIYFNNVISQVVTGQHIFKSGDFAICNNYIKKGRVTIRTDELVHIVTIKPTTHADVAGFSVLVNGKGNFFLPESVTVKRQRLKKAIREEDLTLAKEIQDSWIDLRAAYSCTINKAQGSTYGKVFIDLDDVGKCRNLDQLARLLYVGVSRAKDLVVFTGDIG